MINRVVIRGYRLFADFTFEPQEGLNIIVGDNESGKSTLLEAITLALTCRINGRWAQDELNPYWFNKQSVDSYFDAVDAGMRPDLPEILIELYMSKEDDSLQPMLGVYNSRQEKSPGVRIQIEPNPDYAAEISEYVSADDRPRILPTEWYRVDWRDFSDEKLTRKPRILAVSTIDSRTIRSTAGMDYHTREMLGAFIEPDERAAVAVAHRIARHSISTDTLKPANERIAELGTSLYDKQIGLHMDQSATASWENGIVAHIEDIPFSLSGQGQQAAVKVALALRRTAHSTNYVLIEEPENHLSHTSLTKLVSRIETLSGSRQIFLTTHSSFVLNRLGLNKLVLLHKGSYASFGNLPADTVRYFKRLSGYDTMRLVLAEKIVLVEGPSDEMVFEKAFHQAKGGKLPIHCGIDVISMSGITLKRGLQLCAALNRKAIALRDNDGKPDDHWRGPLTPWLKDGMREIFIGQPEDGRTLESQFAVVNEEATLRDCFQLRPSADLVDWMTSNKTEWALRLEESTIRFQFPGYITRAIDFLT